MLFYKLVDFVLLTGSALRDVIFGGYDFERSASGAVQTCLF